MLNLTLKNNEGEKWKDGENECVIEWELGLH